MSDEMRQTWIQGFGRQAPVRFDWHEAMDGLVLGAPGCGRVYSIEHHDGKWVPALSNWEEPEQSRQVGPPSTLWEAKAACAAHERKLRGMAPLKVVT